MLVFALLISHASGKLLDVCFQNALGKMIRMYNYCDQLTIKNIKKVIFLKGKKKRGWCCCCVLVLVVLSEWGVTFICKSTSVHCQSILTSKGAPFSQS